MKDWKSILLVLILLGMFLSYPIHSIGLVLIIWAIYLWRKNKISNKKSWNPALILIFGLIVLAMSPPISDDNDNSKQVTETAVSSNTLNTDKYNSEKQSANEKKESSDQENNKVKKNDTEKVKDVESEKSEKVTEQKAQVQDKNKQDEISNKEKKKENKPKASSLGLVAATVARVIDGDTIELTDGRKVRLIGVNTPESTTRTEPYGKEASNYTKSKLNGRQIWLQKDVSETDRYGRLLRLVWLEVPTNLMDEKEIRSKMFNADLVINGYAEPSTYPPDVTYAEYFRKFAREAREKGVGLWAYGSEGTTKGDFDSDSSSSTSSNNSNTSNNSNNSSGSSSSSGTENFANCTELRKVYPDGVPEGHPAYQAKMDRDKDGWACER